MPLKVLLSTLALCCLFPLPAREKIRIVFYNTENLFDCYDNEEKEDEEFLPSSLRRWSASRWRQKTEQIARCIASLGEWEAPALVGLCEVENKNTLDQLVYRSSLRSQNYRYVLTDGPDVRGINVALLYQPDLFQLIGWTTYPISLPPSERPTRDILHATGTTAPTDTLDLLICHLPSKRSTASSENRCIALRTLQQKADSILSHRLEPHLLIMGDFNTHCTDPMLSTDFTDQEKRYKSLLSPNSKSIGSYKFNGMWEVIDHFYLNRDWYDRQSPAPPEGKIYQPDFLLEKDKKYGGVKPFRSWNGKRFQKGFSDHLPIYVDLYE